MDVLRYLLNRPIAVSIIFFACALASVLAWFHLPLSLLPDLNVPYITVAVNSIGRNSEDIEQNFLQPLRNGLLSVDRLKDMESVALNESGTLTLRYEHGTKMNLAYVEVNEKIDRLISFLPKGSERPLVMKASSSDIPVLHIQATPRSKEDLMALSELTTHVLKRRIEQIDGVGMVDVNGLHQKVITLELDPQKLLAHNVTAERIIETVKAANIEMGSISVRDGQYRYVLKIASVLRSVNDLRQLPVLLSSGRYVLLQDLANVELSTAKQQGFHLFQNKSGVVLVVHKQPDARLTELTPRLERVVEQFGKDYPQFDFEKSRDQSLLLTLSVQNMYSSLLWGGCFAFVVLFVFMGNWREPLIMGIVLPISLLLSFSLLYLFDISLNIISLSGLALGLGMLVDNSIVVIDSITLKRREGLSIIESCVNGTGEVAVPLISSALTNMAVFVPLIFMGGTSGELFYVQASAVASILSASLLCTFILVPLTYLLMFRSIPTSTREDSRIYTSLKSYYHRSFLFVWKHKKVSLTLMILLIPVAAIQLFTLPKTALPEIERWETLIRVDWNEPITLAQSEHRIKQVVSGTDAVVSTAEGGFRQFVFGNEQFNAQQADIYLLLRNARQRDDVQKRLEDWFAVHFPQARVEFKNAPDPFEQIFATSKPLLEVRLRDLRSGHPLQIPKADSLLTALRKLTSLKNGRGFERESSIILRVDLEKMSSFKVSYETIVDELRKLFDDYPVTEFKSMNEYTPVVFRQSEKDLIDKLNGSLVAAINGSLYPLRTFLSLQFTENYKAITADQEGIYQDVSLTDVDDAFRRETSIRQTTERFKVAGSWQGQWFDNESDLSKLIFIMCMSLLLMYFILTAEFESLKQPLLVLSSFPVGLAGSLLLLMVAGESLNVMSGIGLVVVLGILDNDAILKIDRINKLRRSLPLDRAIEQAGLDRFKPIVMNTFTNVLAITPIIFSSGLGADLQRPVSLAVIGGLIMATLAALYFIPLMYWATDRKN